jgi:hypothetical protein
MRKIIALALFVGLGGCGTFNFMSSQPQVYVAFFPDHSVALTDTAQHIVDHAARDAKMQGMKTLQITGPSVKVAAGYNPALAEPRMEAVEARLVADGVAKARLARASETTDGINIAHDPSGAQRVEIRLVDHAPAD